MSDIIKSCTFLKEVWGELIIIINVFLWVKILKLFIIRCKADDTHKVKATGINVLNDCKASIPSFSVLLHSPTTVSASLYWGFSGSPNTAPLSFSMGTALFIRPPNLPLLRIRSPSRVSIVGQCVNFTIYREQVVIFHSNIYD